MAPAIILNLLGLTMPLDVSDVIPMNVHNILPFFCIFLLILWRKDILQKFMIFLTIFHEVMKLISFEKLDGASMYVTSLS